MFTLAQRCSPPLDHRGLLDGGVNSTSRSSTVGAPAGLLRLERVQAPDDSRPSLDLYVQPRRSASPSLSAARHELAVLDADLVTPFNAGVPGERRGRRRSSNRSAAASQRLLVSALLDRRAIASTTGCARPSGPLRVRTSSAPVAELRRQVRPVTSR